jgi:outer membrane protein
MRIRIVAAAFLSAALAISAAETPLRIAIVDSKALFDGYKGTKEAQDKYDKQVAVWEQEVADKQKELANLKEKFEKQSMMLSDEKKRDLQGLFMSKQAEYQKIVQSLYGKDGRVVKKNEEFTGPIIQLIRGVAQKVAKAEGYEMVLDKASGSVFYVNRDDIDITQKILDRLNADYIGSNAAPVAKPDVAPAKAPAATPAKP